MPLAPPAQAPVPPSVPEARRQLVDELWNPAYAGSWWDRFRGWLADLLRVDAGQVDLSRAFLWVVVALAVLAAVGVAILWWRRRRRPARPDDETGVFDGEPVLTALAYRRRADEHERAGHAEPAVLDRYRAIGACAVERGLVVDAPDLTAHEVGLALTRSFPSHAEATRRAGLLFDRVRYGNGRADLADARWLAGLDAELDATEPVTSRSVPDIPAVPR